MATNEELSALLDATAEGIVRLDAQGRITYLNRTAAHMLAYPAQDLLGQELLVLTKHKNWDNSPCPAEHCPLLQPLRAGQAAQIHCGTFQRRDGTWLSADCLTSPLLINDQVQGVVVTMRDPQMFPQTKENWLHSRKLETIGRVTSEVVHDFNNFLTIVIGYGDLLLQTIPPGDASRPLLEDILKAVDSSAAMAKKLLSIGRKPVVCPQTIDLGAMVKEFAGFIKKLMREDINLTLHLSPNLGPIFADPGQIEQVLMNLVLNARDALPMGGTITIKTANVLFDKKTSFPPGGYVLLTVSDNGIGMSAEVGSHIFDPFFTTKGPNKGTGLGLANVQQIVLQNQGFIEVISELGQGTSFNIYFPHAHKTPDKPVASALPLPSYQGWETILVVATDPNLNRMLTHALSNFGYTLLPAHDFSEALCHCLDYPRAIHLMLCDEMTQNSVPPEMMANFLLCRPDMKYLFLSDHPYPSGQMGKENIPVFFLDKPINLGPLMQKIQAILTTNGTSQAPGGSKEKAPPSERVPIPISPSLSEPRKPVGLG